MKFKHKSSSCKLSPLPDGQTFMLVNVFSMERGQGHATELMRIVMDYADEHNLTLVLTARKFHYTDTKSPNDEGLVTFYEKFGFSQNANKFRPYIMVRRPNSRKIQSV